MKNLPDNLRTFIEQARQAVPAPDTALRSFRSLDLTSLGDDDTPEKIAALCERADQGELGHVAATCVYPKFLAQTFNATAEKGIHRATVINFPSGKGTVEQTEEDTRAAVAAGADEIDIVLDYESFLGGNRETAEQLLQACRRAAGDNVSVKVILETAVFDDYKDLYDAAMLALDCGANFLKTSTGKHPKGGFTLEAAAVLLQAIGDSKSEAGLKVSGGVDTLPECAQIFALAETMMGPGWATPDRFRIGASSILKLLLQELGKAPPASSAAPQPPSAY